VNSNRIVRDKVGAALFGPFISIYEPDGEYGILSNFAEVTFVEDGETWSSVEHFYQAGKFASADQKTLIRNAVSGREAKAIAWSEPLHRSVRADWDDVRISVMRRALLLKFQQSQAARRALLSTWPLPIIESCPINDFWGVGGSGGGQNWLGVLLEEVRALLGGARSPVQFSPKVSLKGAGGASRVEWTLLQMDQAPMGAAPPPLAYDGFLQFDVSEMLAGGAQQPVEAGDDHCDRVKRDFELHARILDTKYANYSWYQDSRSAVVAWKLRFFGMLARVCDRPLDELRVVAVGAGSAGEASQLWNEFSDRAVLVDWGYRLVENCRRQAPRAEVRRCRAERLEGIPDATADVYCALRTFDSAFLDPSTALLEAHRVLRQGGRCIVSVSNGYLGRDGGLVSGQIGKCGSLEKLRPWNLLLKIGDLAVRMGFVDFAYFDLESELAICFKKEL
jgi:ribA/ribD-fused uncharacterized protein